MTDASTGTIRGQPNWWPLRKVLLRPPLEPLSTPSEIERWGYRFPLDLKVAGADHTTFADTLRTAGVVVLLNEEPVTGLIDSVFATDAALPTDRGVILLHFGKALRVPEVDVLERGLARQRVPILGRIAAPGTVEGGDCLWLTPDTLLVGDGYRTNQEGIAQLRHLLPGVDVVAVPLPYGDGPGACLHLQSLISVVRSDLVLAYPRYMPVSLVRLLEEGGFTRIDVPDEEYDSLGTNALCLQSGHVVLPDGNPKTAAALRDRGVRVTEVPGDALMRNGSGGPTCLTLVLEREEPKP